MTYLLELLPLIILLITLGSLAGFMAGLLGIGGGTILVPGLYYSFTVLGYDSSMLMHLAVGTSLATIIPTGLASSRAHWKKGAVDIALLKIMGPGILAGTAAGTYIAGQVSSESLQIFFAVMVLALAGLMAADPARFKWRSSMPGHIGCTGVGGFIGACSTLMGIGGAAMNVPFMTMCQLPIYKAVGTASALGLVVAIPATFGFIFIGWDVPNRPEFSLGYVNMLAWIIIIPLSVAAAPWGAKAAHSLSVKKLRLSFALFMVFVSAKMFYEVFYG